MLLKDLLPINEPLKKLCGKRLKNFKVSRELAILLKKIESETEIYSSEYKKIIDEYAKHDENGKIVTRDNNSFELKDPELGEKYMNEYRALLNTDVGFIEPIIISDKDFVNSNDYPTAQEMNQLDCVINWIYDQQNNN